MVDLDTNTLGLQYIIIQVVFTWLALIAVGLRLWARHLTEANVDCSDYACLVALVFVLGQAGVGIASVVLGGVGLHSAVLNSQQLTIARQTLFAEGICWLIANCFVKLSILHFLNAIFRRKPWFSRIFRPLSVFVMLTCLACVLARFLQCRPLAYIWNPSIPGGTCLSALPMGAGAAIISLVLDVMIFILPIPVILALQMRRLRKGAIVAVFGLGAVICIISGLRIASIFNVDSSDMTYTIVNTSQWSILDNSLGIVSACVPLLPPILQHTTGHDFFAWTRRPSQQMSQMHSPTGSLYHDGIARPPRAYRRPSSDMASLAWGGANRTPSHLAGSKGGSIWSAHPIDGSGRHHSSKPSGYRGLGGRRERARGPPLAFNPNYFYPPGLRRTLSHHGSVSSVRSPSFLSSLAPSRSLSQRNTNGEQHARSGSRHGGRDSRLDGSRHGSRVVSRLGSRRGSRSNSRAGRRSDEDDDAHDLALYPTPQHDGGDSTTHVAIVSHGRAPSPADGSLAGGGGGAGGLGAGGAPGTPKGITVTTTWDIDVESLKSAPEDEYDDDDEPYGFAYDAYDSPYDDHAPPHSRSRSRALNTSRPHSRPHSRHNLSGHGRPELVDADHATAGNTRNSSRRGSLYRFDR